MAKDPRVGPVTVGYTEGQLRTVNLPEGQQDPLATATAPMPVQQSQPLVLFDPSQIKVVILAGGRGTRLQDVSKGVLPKPMIRVGEMPLVEHIMRIYAAQGFRKFIIAAGFLKEVIIEWVADNRIRLRQMADEIEVVDTGEDTQTGGRIRALADHLNYGPFFMMTYGDGLSDVNLAALLDLHLRLQLQSPQGLVTLTAARPPARFGSMDIGPSGFVRAFGEKVQMTEGWINSGFYVIDRSILRLIAGENSKFEYDVLPILASQQSLAAFQHPGFFQMVDNWRDLQTLKELWASGNPPWARWQTG